MRSMRRIITRNLALADSLTVQSMVNIRSNCFYQLSGDLLQLLVAQDFQYAIIDLQRIV